MLLFKLNTVLSCTSSAKNVFQSWGCRGTAAIVPCSIRKTVMVSANIHIQLNSAFYLEFISFYYIPTVCTSSILFQHYSALFFPQTVSFSLTIRCGVFSFFESFKKNWIQGLSFNSCNCYVKSI